MKHLDNLVKEYIQEQGIDKRLYNAIVDTAKMLFVLFMNADTNKVQQNLHQVLDGEDYEFICNNQENQERLKRLFAVLDTVYLQFKVLHLSLWIIHQDKLFCLLSFGEKTQTSLDIICEHKHLVARTANSAWFNLVSHSQEWVDCQELSCDFYKQDKMLWAFPICKPTGAVMGVLYGEDKPDDDFTEEQQIWYTALTVILSEILQNLLEK